MPMLSFSLLTKAPLAIQLHAFAAIAAFGLGTYLLNGRKGVRLHRVLGWTWAVLMLTIAATSFWIVDLRTGQFSPIHLLSVLTLVMLPYALYKARTHAVTAHSKTMRGLYWGALIIAGAFTFLPGRLMYRVVFG